MTFFSGHAEALSAESKLRLEKNPLRILDSKDAGDRTLVAEAPLIGQHLSAAAAEFYDGLKAALAAFGVPFVENPHIVRGLDYYNHTAFEFVTSALGAQGTVLAGGRYDGLVEQMGGPSVPGVGWAAGIERLAMLIDAPAAPPGVVAVVPMEPGAEAAALLVVKALRDAGVAAETAYQGNAKRRLERAAKSGAAHAVLVHAAAEMVKLKTLSDGTQTECSVEDLIRTLRG